MIPSRNRKLNRLKDYDYSQVGCYFITLCTQNRQELFGEIINEAMVLNQLGKIVDNFWQKIPNYYKYIEIKEFVVMPNHLHGLIIINKHIDVAEVGISVGVGTEHCSVPTKIENGKNYGQLSKMVKSFKNAVTNNSKKALNEKIEIWQRSFYGHIIHHETELIRIRDYIINNPLKWSLDRNNKENILM